MTIQEMMTPNPVCCTPETTIRDAACMMRDENVGSLPVVESMDSRRICGMVTDRDLAIHCVANGMDPNTTQVSHSMTRDVVCCRPDAQVDDCLNKMEEMQVRRMPVADGQGCLIGIVAQADVAMMASDQQTAQMVERVSQPYMG